MPVLTETDAGFYTLFLHNPQPMWVFDLQTFEFLEVNEAAIQQYGYSRAEFLQMGISHIRPEEDISRLEKYIARNREDAQSRGKWSHRLKDGSLIYVDVIAQNVIFRGRQARLVVLRDITKQKQAEEALRQAGRKYRLIFEEAIVGLYQSTPDGRTLSANPALARMYGFDSPEELAAYVTDVRSQIYVDPTRRSEFQRLMEEEGMVRHFEVQVYRKDRSKIWLSVNGRAVREHDTVVRYDGTAEDITELKNLRDQLQEAQEQYREIVDNAVVGIFQSTPEGRYLKVNRAMAKMLGYDSPQELVEGVTNIQQQVYVDSKRRDELKDLTNQGVVKDMECEVYRKDGSKIWVSENVRAVRDSIWSSESYRQVFDACVQHKPDIAHVHNFWMRVSPSVHTAFRDAAVPSVQSLHNYRLTCANGLMLRDQHVCGDCVGRLPWRAVVHRCYSQFLRVTEENYIQTIPRQPRGLLESQHRLTCARPAMEHTSAAPRHAVLDVPPLRSVPERKLLNDIRQLRTKRELIKC